MHNPWRPAFHPRGSEPNGRHFIVQIDVILSGSGQILRKDGTLSCGVKRILSDNDLYALRRFKPGRHNNKPQYQTSHSICTEHKLGNYGWAFLPFTHRQGNLDSPEVGRHFAILAET